MRDWYDVDELRESWCFLSLQHEEGPTDHLLAWELADGNADQIVRTESLESSPECSHRRLVEQLEETIDERRSNGALLLTINNSDLAQLRRQLVGNQHVEPATLRGFRHVCLEALCREYFDVEDLESFLAEFEISNRTSGSNSALSVTVYRELLTEIAPLVPAEALRGEVL